MDDRAAEIGAQKIDDKSSKEDVSSDVQEKISDASLSTSTPSIEHSNHDTGQTNSDVETAEEEIAPSPVKVPRSKRRGLFGRFTILAEVEEPKHYSRRTKWFITFNIALAAVAAPLGSAIIFRMLRSPRNAPRVNQLILCSFSSPNIR